MVGSSFTHSTTFFLFFHISFFCCIHTEIIDMMRKMLLTGILVYVRPSGARPVVASIICLLSSCLLNYYQPYKNRILLWMAQGSFLLTAFKYLLTLLGVSLDLEEGNKRLMGEVLIFFDCLVIVGGGLCAVAIFVVLKTTVEKVQEIQRKTSETSHVVVPTTAQKKDAINMRPSLSIAHFHKALAQQNVGEVTPQSESSLKHFKKVQAEKHGQAKKRLIGRLQRRGIALRNEQSHAEKPPSLNIAHLHNALAQEAVGKVTEPAKSSLNHLKKMQVEKHKQAQKRMSRRLQRRMMALQKASSIHL